MVGSCSGGKTGRQGRRDLVGLTVDEGSVLTMRGVRDGSVKEGLEGWAELGCTIRTDRRKEAGLRGCRAGVRRSEVHWRRRREVQGLRRATLQLEQARFKVGQRPTKGAKVNKEAIRTS